MSKQISDNDAILPANNPVVPGFPNGLNGSGGDGESSHSTKALGDIGVAHNGLGVPVTGNAAVNAADPKGLLATVRPDDYGPDPLDFHNTIQTYGKPTGPLVFVPEFGSEVKTFTRYPSDGRVCLMHHVPFNKRGPFRPEQLANFDENRKYRTDVFGYVLCYAKNQFGEPCKTKAQNRFPRCGVHGGRLHPLDRTVRKGFGEGSQTEDLSRYQMFLAKMITVDDLDDEEVLNFGFRRTDGTLFKPKNIPREMVNSITRAIYDRALNEIKVNAVTAAKTLATIMVDPNNDASIRLKAAEAILDRSIGKAPQTLNIATAAPWEEIFESISTVTRNQSRAVRGDVLDVDVIGQNDGFVEDAPSVPS